MRVEERTRAYVVRRTAVGKSRREIMRCLKRYVAREVYRVLTSSVAPAGSSVDGDRVAAVTGVT
jgi:transposase